MAPGVILLLTQHRTEWYTAKALSQICCRHICRCDKFTALTLAHFLKMKFFANKNAELQGAVPSLFWC